MKNKTKLILIGLIVIAGVIYSNLGSSGSDASYETLANTSIGTVEKCVYGNENAPKCIALITGIHPREPLSIEPEIKAAQQYENDDVKIIHYKVTVTDRPTDYNAGRANGESLVHDYVNPDVTKSDAGAVIISHSHMPGYGQGFYLATPEMDDASVSTRQVTSTIILLQATKATSQHLQFWYQNLLLRRDILHSYTKFRKT